MNILNNSINLLSLSHAFSSTLFVYFSESPSNSLHYLLLSSLNMLALFLALSIHLMPPESLFLHSLNCLGAFGLLELKIWAEHWTMSGLQDRFRLLCCCYNLNLKTVLLNLGLFMKVLGLCLSFPYI
jgi:hypothetical protein